MKSFKRYSKAALLMTLMTGCAKAPFNVCPPLIVYSNEFQQEATKELDTCLDCENVRYLLNDYKAVRDSLRVCLKR
jgi:hypothetical protein